MFIIFVIIRVMVNKYILYITVLSIAITVVMTPKTIRAAALPEGTLVKSASEKVYIIENGLKRWIKTADVFNRFKYSWGNINIVSNNILDDIPPGNDISDNFQYPDGTLLKGSAPQVYILELKQKHWIPSPEIFTTKGFKWQNIVQVSDQTLNNIKKGQDISMDYNPLNLRPETFILDGPCKQYQDTIPEIETSKIKFKYSGKKTQGDSTGLAFETFLAGYDKEWQGSWWFSSYTREISLPAENKIYTFYVRTKSQDGYYDITPAFCKFKTRLSPYYQQVKIYSVSGGSTTPSSEQITLATSWSFSGNIDITNWTITTTKSKLTIPQAIKLIQPESSYNFKSDIILKGNETLVITGGASPIGIDAYQSNKCLSYLNKPQEYKNCFYENNQYPDFLKSEWRLYLNYGSEFLANKNELIILKDKNGLTVDSYSY